MKINIAMIIVGGLLIFNNNTVQAQVKRNHNLLNRDVGPIVTSKAFDQMVNEMMTKMKSDKQLKIDDLVTIVRIDNTIGMSAVIEVSKVYDEFDTLFVSKFLGLTVKRLHAKLGNGMGFYSPKYNLYWGGYPDYNSMFRIIKPTSTSLVGK
ncbi:MAG: hypothetical protein V4592_25440 [Bacteroidota bacterium]